MFGFTTNGILAIIAAVGVAFVSYRIFTDEMAAHRNRKEEGFDLFDSDED